MWLHLYRPALGGFSYCPPGSDRAGAGAGVGDLDVFTRDRTGERLCLPEDSDGECVIGLGTGNHIDSARGGEPCSPCGEEVNKDRPVLSEDLGADIIAISAIATQIDGGDNPIAQFEYCNEVVDVTNFSQRLVNERESE